VAVTLPVLRLVATTGCPSDISIGDAGDISIGDLHRLSVPDRKVTISPR
jgi:hypothetical protein